MTALVVADTTVWSNFAHGGRPRLVQDAFPGVTSPRAVLDEVAEGHRLGFLPGFDWAFVQEIELTELEATRAEEFEARLGPGEAACIALARARGALLLTDDRAARRLARALEIKVSGTLGVLARLVDSRRLSVDEADDLLARDSCRLPQPCAVARRDSVTRDRVVICGTEER
jgi:predicted nucleic acid-binding protein